MGTRWRQPFCACVVTYDALDGDRPIGLVVEERCELHGHLEPEEHFRTLLWWNRERSVATESD